MTPNELNAGVMAYIGLLLNDKNITVNECCEKVSEVLKLNNVCDKHINGYKDFIRENFDNWVAQRHTSV